MIEEVAAAEEFETKTEHVESEISMNTATSLNEKTVIPTLLHTHLDRNDQYLVLNRSYGVLNRVKSIDEGQVNPHDNDFYNHKPTMTNKEIDYTQRTKGWLPQSNGIIQRMTSLDSDQTRFGSMTGFDEDHEIIDSEISDEEQLPSKMFRFELFKPRDIKLDDEFIMIESKVVKKTDWIEYDTDDEDEVILVDPEIGKEEILDTQFDKTKRFSSVATQTLTHNQVNSPEFTPTTETVSSCASSPPSPTFLPSNISLNISLHVPNSSLASNNLDTKMSPWTSDEDKLLIDAVLDSLTPSWVQISENVMMQRSEDACRLRWARLKKRLYGSA